VSAHRALLLAVLAASIGAARPASAQHVEARGTFVAGFQGTDNVQFVPNNGLPGAPTPTPAFVADLTPAAVLSYETPRWLHELQYTLNLATIIGIGQQYNYTNRLEARSKYDVSDLTVANFAVRATQGQLTFFPSFEAGKPVAAFAPGTFTFVTGEVAQNITHRLGERTGFNEGVTLNVFRPIDADPPRPAVYGVNFQAALQYTDEPDNYNINFGSQLGVTEEIECTDDAQCGGGRVCAVALRRCVIPDTTAAPLKAALQAQVNAPVLANRLGAGWRHDFLNGFNLDLNIGVQQAMRLTDGGGQNWQPVGRAALQYQEEDAAIQLTLNHGAQLNVDIGGLVMATNADLVGTVPLDRRTRNFMLTIQTGYQRGTPFDTFGVLLPGFHVAAADVGLAYRPERWLPNLQAGIRYQFRVQITEAQAGVSVVPVDLVAMRNAVVFNIGFDYPERKQGP
jgi:hypothetical protein